MINTNKKAIITVCVLAITSIALAIHWNEWKSGIIIGRARNTERHYYHEIIVRKVPMNKNPIGMLGLIDSYYYQCEFHRAYGNGRPWSYQTYTGDSFIATHAQIKWTTENDAIVYLDNYPVFHCSDGWWTQAKLDK